MNTTRTTARAVAFVCAALVTVATLVGVDGLASHEHAASAAQWAAATSTLPSA